MQKLLNAHGRSRICGLPPCARRLGGFCITPRTPRERPRRTPYNHQISEISGVPGTRRLVDREDIQRIAARNLGGEYSLLDVKDEREAAELVGRALAELFVGDVSRHRGFRRRD